MNNLLKGTAKLIDWTRIGKRVEMLSEKWREDYLAVGEVHRNGEPVGRILSEELFQFYIGGAEGITIANSSKEE